MNLTNNTLKSICDYFLKELQETYDETELIQIRQIAFFHFFGWTRTDLALNHDDIVSKKNTKKIIELVTMLKTNKPLAQIIGAWEFYGLTFKVNEHTLIPRPETEELIQVIVNENNDCENCHILDIGTGTGCIAITLKSEMEKANVTAFDISEEALKIARVNAKFNDLNVTFKQVNILDCQNQKKKKKYNVIVSNPPYIPEKERSLMHQNVLDFEPDLALFVENEEPLIFYERIADFALENLSPEGKIYFEINENYGSATKQLLIDKSFKKVCIIKDINEKDRIVKAIFS